MLKRCLFFWMLVFFGTLLNSCEQGSNNKIKEYLFLGHTYQWGVKDNNRIDYRFEGFNFEKYDQIWLGGDMAARTNESLATLNYMDSIFDLSVPTTHWTLGNHDINHGALSQIESITGRKSYYTSTFDGISLVVLNTNEFHHPLYSPKPHECEMLEDQLQLLQNLADTIQDVSHVVVLHHHALLTNEMTHDSLKMNKIFNLYNEDVRVDCASKYTFESKIYPILKKIQKKGIQVILVSGDLGQRSKSFEYQTAEGLWFLGSGINNSAIDIYLPEYVTDTSPDKVLIFEHDIDRKILTWKYVLLSDLTGKKY
ncbi:MAG: hypothetical protein ACI8P3_003422 [Saprospiraceae bacterium]|jgi:hypothetical protein